MSTDPLTFASSHLEETEYEAFEVYYTELCRQQTALDTFNRIFRSKTDDAKKIQYLQGLINVSATRPGNDFVTRALGTLSSVYVG